MKLLFEKAEQVLSPYLKTEKVDESLMDRIYKQSGESQSMLTLMSHALGDFDENKFIASDIFSPLDQKLVYYSGGKEFRIYDGYKIKAGEDEPTLYCLRVSGDILLYISVLPSEDLSEISVVSVDGDIPSLHFTGSHKNESFPGTPISIASVNPKPLNNGYEVITLSPFEVYIENGLVQMISINNKQII